MVAASDPGAAGRRARRSRAMASNSDLIRQLRGRALRLAGILAGVLIYGTTGYRLLSDGRASWLDAFYMTVITVTTIGFGEVVPGGDTMELRLFTVTVAFLGVSFFAYAVSNITFFATDERLRAYWRKRRMENTLRDWTGHYIIAGWNRVAAQIAAELQATGRRWVAIAPPGEAGVERHTPPGTGEQLLEGDPTDESSLRAAGIERAAGFFAAETGDTTNIVACLAARALNPQARIVAAANDPANIAKLRRAGADAVVSATQIGALRMASEMVRPTVVSFLDTMLRSGNPPLRVEELTPATRHAGAPLRRLMEAGGGRALLVAVRRGDAEWEFNPPADRAWAAGETLVLITPPETLEELRRAWCESG